MINTTSVYYEVACKFCQSVRNFCSAVFNSMVEARQMQAYYEIAQRISHKYPNKSVSEIIEMLKEQK
jgi:hypothetical protein